ncbi:VWA domain-containing protein [Halosquirtibacter xylanolyticus]|uniref:vWA domain-containing protein n=1 Tax=Halosquirtibacter xylanolyticus TaxID=3374599 RepID=UPI0037481834|nr:VWA domain-containing protein [Prolixibacteraceae bacterium]
MNSFRFAHPEYLYLLILIPLLVLGYWILIGYNKRRVEKFGNYQFIQALMPNKSSFRKGLIFALSLLAAVFLIFAIAQPQFGSKMRKIKKKGIQIMVALDVSNSMLAEDIKPSRLERAKMAVSKLTDKLNNDQIGLIVFGGQAYTQIPITSDYASAKMFLSSVNTQMVPVQGTAIGSAIELATKSFSPDYTGSKAIIVITDGENHEDDAIGAATTAKEQGIKVFTLGMGLPQGAPVPVIRNQQRTFIKDKSGKTVISKLNENMLKKIAQAGSGSYVRANNTNIGLNAIFSEINKMDKKAISTRQYAEYDDQFPYFIGASLLFFALSMMLIERKNKWLARVNIFGKDKKHA